MEPASRKQTWHSSTEHWRGQLRGVIMDGRAEWSSPKHFYVCLSKSADEQNWFDRTVSSRHGAIGTELGFQQLHGVAANNGQSSRAVSPAELFRSTFFGSFKTTMFGLDFYEVLVGICQSPVPNVWLGPKASRHKT